MSAQKPEEIIQQIYAAFGRGDLPALLSLLADDVQWTLNGKGSIPYGGRHAGKAAVERWFGLLGGTVTFTQFEIDRTIAKDSTVICFGREAGTVKATGKSYATPLLHVWEIANGRVASFSDYFDSDAISTAHAR